MDAAAPTDIDRRLLSVVEAAKSLGISRSLVFRLIQSGQLHSVTIGDRRLIPPSALDAYVDELSR